MEQLLAALTQAINDFVAHDPGNAMAAHGGMRMYEEPLVAVATANDEWFIRFTESGIVGPQYMTPDTWLAGARSVVCWFLPFTKIVRDTNRAPGLPSEEWASAKIDGEAFNNALKLFVTDWLHRHSAEAVAPTCDKRFSVVNRLPNWSERHAAFVAGLGTFGLHRALITAKGTAGRLGSVISTLKLDPTPRPYTRHDEYCPFLSQLPEQKAAGKKPKCGACIRRCPAHAISESGKAHDICSDFIDNEVLPLYAPRYGCAKCNVGVPCEAGIPKS